MGTIRPLRSRYVKAIVLGLCAAAVTFLPPLKVAERIDNKVYDLWSQLFLFSAATGIVLVDLDDPAWLTALAELARHDKARLLVTTLAYPPSPAANHFALGPTELSLGPQLLRRSTWEQGGHLWFKPGVDGVVRTETPLIQDAVAIPSLAYKAHQVLASDSKPLINDSHIRYFDRGAFEWMTPEDLQEAAGQLHDRIVIAGRTTSLKETSVGAMTEHELLAHILAGYNANALVGSLAGLTAGAWMLVLLPLAMIAVRPRLFVRHRLLPLTVGALGLLGISATAFAAFGTWMPVAGPGTLLLTTSALLFARPNRHKRPGLRPAAGSNLDAARGQVASGEHAAAWAAYRDIPTTKALFEELYELATALEKAGKSEYAADVFYRIAQVDVLYRDVANRLISTTQGLPPGTDPAPLKLRGEQATTLGRYELLAPVGQGATGKVFLARDPDINRIVAIKVIDLTADCDPAEFDGTMQGFRREAETAGRLNHHGIVTVFDIGESDGLAYIAMEYLKGRHLSDFTRPDSLLPAPLVLELGAKIADALDYAHGQNVVHRDIKPSNIMYDSLSGSLKITDFGIARLIDVSRTRSGIVLGTPSFMAPEQLEGKNVNGHTDLFALGVSLYELLTGRLPFRGASMTKLMFVIANEPHQPVTSVRPELPPQLDAVFDIVLSKDPSARYQRGREMADSLRTIAGQMG